MASENGPKTCVAKSYDVSGAGANEGRDCQWYLELARALGTTDNRGLRAALAEAGAAAGRT
jgi:hypothetical protein